MSKSLEVSSTPPLRETFLKLKRVKPGGGGFVRICSRKVFGYCSHWYQGHSHPCYGKQCECPPPMDKLYREWHGVLHVWDPVKKEQFLLEITDRCCDSLRDQVADYHNLRGLRVQFTRSSESKKGRIICTVDGNLQIERDLPAEVDPLTTLDVIWKKKPPMDLRAFAG